MSRLPVSNYSSPFTESLTQLAQLLRNGKSIFRAQELCESRGGRPGLTSLINLRFLWT